MNNVRNLERPLGVLFVLNKFWGCGMEIPVGIISALFGMLLTLLTFNRNRDKEVKTDAAENAVVRTKLDQIGQGVDSIRLDLKGLESNTRREITDLSEKVIRVEESSKQAHKRIDELSKIKEEVR